MAAPADCDRGNLGVSGCDVGCQGLRRLEVLFFCLLLLDETYSGVPCNPIVGEFLKTRVIGKICPRCGKPGSIVYQTKERIVFECPNGHQFEMKREKKSITKKPQS
jgi:hypothetical protein